MENVKNEDLAKCPYHSQLNLANQDTQDNENIDEREEASRGDWDKERDDARTDEAGYNADRNDNSGGAGSSGSASTNS